MSFRLYQRDRVGTSFAPDSTWEIVGVYDGDEHGAHAQLAIRAIQESGRVFLTLHDPQRYIGRCPKCKTPASALVDTRRTTRHEYGRERVFYEPSTVQLTDPCVTIDPWPTVACSECGARVGLQRIKGKHVPDHPCDRRCTSARGHNCECSCGGANHGADWTHA